MTGYDITNLHVNCKVFPKYQQRVPKTKYDFKNFRGVLKEDELSTSRHDFDPGYRTCVGYATGSRQSMVDTIEPETLGT